MAIESPALRPQPSKAFVSCTHPNTIFITQTPHVPRVSARSPKEFQDPAAWSQGREWQGLPFRMTSACTWSGAKDICMHESMLWMMDRGRSSLRWRDRGVVRQRLLVPETAVFWREGVRLTDIEMCGPQASLAVLFPNQLIEQWLGDEAAQTLRAVSTIGALRFRLDPPAMRWMRAIAAEIKAGCPQGAAFSESVSISLITYLAQTWSGRDPPPALEGVERAAVRKALEFVEGNLAADLSLSQLARVACLSPRQLARCFKAAQGVSVHQYILDRRIERAKPLLAREPISQVAMDLGFASPSHFSTAFHARTGMTPSRFKAASLKEGRAPEAPGLATGPQPIKTGCATACFAEKARCWARTGG